MWKAFLICCISIFIAGTVCRGMEHPRERKENLHQGSGNRRSGQLGNGPQDSTARRAPAPRRSQDSALKNTALATQVPDTGRRQEVPVAIADSVIPAAIDTTAICKAPLSLDAFSGGSPGSRPATAGPYGNAVQAFIKNHPYFKAAEKTLRLPTLEHRPARKEWVFYLFIGLLCYLALLRLAFPKYFADMFRVFFNSSLRQKQIREQLIQEPLPSLLLNIFFIVSGGLFLNFLFLQQGLGAGYARWLLPLACMALIAAVYLVKFIVIRGLGWIFGKGEAVDAYLFIVFMVNKIAGMVLLPFAFLLAYAEAEEAAVLVFLSLLALGILGLYRLARSYVVVHKPFRINQLYFILFVAAFEVVPILLLYKGLNSLL
jgi:Domain of unknown function (DUF4271)